MSVTEKVFGKIEAGTGYLYEMANASGMSVSVTNLGAAVVSLRVPDKMGGTRDVVFGFDHLEAYAVNPSFFGVVVGRVANRIGGASFELDGKTYTLEKNDGPHHLHGGSAGFDKKLWTVQPYDKNINRLTLQYISPGGEAGYPGRLTASVTYTLTDGNALRIDYAAETDTKTICNLTNHTYFNLEGHAAKDISRHEVQILADRITEVDDTLIPTGGYTDVTGTPFDFRAAKPLGQDIDAAGGYDHNFVLNAPGTAARVYAPGSGVTLEVRTSSPGMQLYSGNFLTGDVLGKEGVYYPKRSGFCMETQIFPDAVHQPGFPSCVVEKGKGQAYFTEFAFGIKK